MTHDWVRPPPALTPWDPPRRADIYARTSGLSKSRMVWDAYNQATFGHGRIRVTKCSPTSEGMEPKTATVASLFVVAPEPFSRSGRPVGDRSCRCYLGLHRSCRCPPPAEKTRAAKNGDAAAKRRGSGPVADDIEFSRSGSTLKGRLEQLS